VLDKAIYRYALIPATRKALLEQGKSAQWMKSRPPWGPGRIDPFNPVKFGMLKMDPKNDDTVGNSDMMPLWSMDQRKSTEGYQLHWDGLSTDLLHCSLAGALGDGATKKSLPVKHSAKLVEELKIMPAPLWPLQVNEKLASEGKIHFDQHCAQCHALEGAFVNRPYDFAAQPNSLQHATDPHRLAMWNATDAKGRAPFQIYNQFADGYSWDLNSFVATKGYTAAPLNGVWACGPFLHNGSVPSLADLLNPPFSAADAKAMIDSISPHMFDLISKEMNSSDNPHPSQSDANQARGQIHKLVNAVVTQSRQRGMRPPVFLRGCDVLDETHVGFVSDGSVTVGRNGLFLYATFVQGNSNAGHLYGTELTKEQKLAIIEFLKTSPKAGGVANVK
jgi:hypothetical protein